MKIPQMTPMNWTLLFLMYSFILLGLSVKVYFIK